MRTGRCLLTIDRQTDKQTDRQTYVTLNNELDSAFLQSLLDHTISLFAA